MCDHEKTQIAGQPAAEVTMPQPDGPVGASSESSRRRVRSKFRPFTGDRMMLESRETGTRRSWSERKDIQMENVREKAQELADAIERAREHFVGDARSAYEFDLSRTALEDCVMRATRGITS